MNHKRNFLMLFIVTLLCVATFQSPSYAQSFEGTPASDEDVQEEKVSQDLPVDGYGIEGFYTTRFVDTMAELMLKPNQASTAVYDSYSNRTFVVYTGCAEGKGPECYTDPFFTFYDHTTDSWSSKVDLGDALTEHDSHNYPQIIVDDNHKIHVFFGNHAAIGAERPIQHFWSTDGVWWQSSYFGIYSKTADATYPLAFKDDDGEIYVFYRWSKELGQTQCGGSQCVYEPHVFVKSTDNGASWSNPKVYIDPSSGPNACTSHPNDDDSDEWDTIYIKAANHDPDKNGVHIVFSNHRYHNDFVGDLHYVFFDFDNDYVYGPPGSSGGHNFGGCINQGNFDNYGVKVVDIPYGSPGTVAPYAVTEIDTNNRPNVVYAYTQSTPYGSFRYMKRKYYSGGWSSADCLAGPGCEFQGENVIPMEIEFYSSSSFDVYVNYCQAVTLPPYYEYSTVSLVKQRYSGSDLQYETVLRQHDVGKYDPEIMTQYFNFDFVANRSPSPPDPDIKAVFLQGTYTYWGTPKPMGKYYALWEN